MNGPKVAVIAAPHGGNCVVRIWPYAGTPENPALRAAACGCRDNASGAGNQQERPVRLARGLGCAAEKDASLQRCAADTRHRLESTGILRDHTPEVQDTGS